MWVLFSIFFSLKDETRFLLLSDFQFFLLHIPEQIFSVRSAFADFSKIVPVMEEESLTHLKLHSKKKKSHAYTDFLGSISRTFFLLQRSDCRLFIIIILFLSSFFSFFAHMNVVSVRARALTRLLRHPQRFLRLLPSPSYRWRHRLRSRLLLLLRLACPKSRESGCLVITA